MAIKIINKNTHIVIFDTLTGEFEREVLEDSKKPSGPDLLDISITNKCSLGCEICYKKSTPNGIHMSLDDLKNIVSQAKRLGVVQIAYGGGNPNEHPNFYDILKFTKEAGIVPNFTTNGYNLTEDHVYAIEKYCGAVGLSLYDDIEHFKHILSILYNKGVRVNAHIVLQGGNTDVILERLSNIKDVVHKLNAVILLNYKPINKQIKFSKLKKVEFDSVIDNCVDLGFEKIGFDSCLASYVSKILENKHYTFCDSAIYSAYISEELKVSPCSFVATNLSLDLKKHSLKQIWDSNMFTDFTSSSLNEKCAHCEVLDLCKGGCGYFNINYCYPKDIKVYE